MGGSQETLGSQGRRQLGETVRLCSSKRLSNPFIYFVGTKRTGCENGAVYAFHRELQKASTKEKH